LQVLIKAQSDYKFTQDTNECYYNKFNRYYHRIEFQTFLMRLTTRSWAFIGGVRNFHLGGYSPGGLRDGSPSVGSPR